MTKKPTDENKTMTPIVPRTVIFVMYFYVSFCGLKLLLEGFEFSYAKYSVTIFTLLYSLEFLWSLYPGWISMYGVNMKHMWEHHFPGMLLGIALVVHFHRADREAASFLDY